MKKYKIKYRNRLKDKQKQIEKRYKVLIVLIFIVLSILVGYLFYVQVIRCDFFKEKVKKATVKVVLGDSAPRGRIYDRNGKLIVDNIAVNASTQFVINIIRIHPRKSVKAETRVAMLWFIVIPIESTSLVTLDNISP